MSEDPKPAQDPGPQVEPLYRGMSRLQIMAAVMDLCSRRAKNGDPTLTHDQVVELLFPDSTPQQYADLRGIVKQARFLELYSSRWPYSSKSPVERRSLINGGQEFECGIEMEGVPDGWRKGQLSPPLNTGRLYIDQPKDKLYAALGLWATEGNKTPAALYLNLEGVERRVAAFVQSELRGTGRWQNAGSEYGHLDGPPWPRSHKLSDIIPQVALGRLNRVLTAILMAYHTQHRPPAASFTLQPISARSSASDVSSIRFHQRTRRQNVQA